MDRRNKKLYIVYFVIGILILGGGILHIKQKENVMCLSLGKDAEARKKSTINKYKRLFGFFERGEQGTVHRNITTTIFWIGEGASDDNAHISNQPSAWDEDWTTHYGGVDDPENRNGYFPADFIPKENPFYVALPYNDFNEDGKRKNRIRSLADWYGEKKWGENESVCKNQWIKITKGDKVVYAQWEDVGPFGEDDISYVFGDSQPKNKRNNKAGLDVSPAVRDYLGLEDIDKADWQFVDAKDVPDGPWKEIVTSSQVNWN